MLNMYIKLIADIPKQELEVWQNLLFSLREGLGVYESKEEWLESFKLRKYVYVLIDKDKDMHANTVNVLSKDQSSYESITLEILQTLNLLKLTGG